LLDLQLYSHYCCKVVVAVLAAVVGFFFGAVPLINSNYVKCNILINTFAKTGLKVRETINLLARPLGCVLFVVCWAMSKRASGAIN